MWRKALAIAGRPIVHSGDEDKIRVVRELLGRDPGPGISGKRGPGSIGVRAMIVKSHHVTVFLLLERTFRLVLSEILHNVWAAHHLFTGVLDDRIARRVAEDWQVIVIGSFI